MRNSVNVVNCDQFPEIGEPILLREFFLVERRFPAVYFLYSRGELVYVGQTKTLKWRIENHLTEGVKVFDAVAFIECRVDQLLLFESHYIRKLAPKYNNCTATKKVRQRQSWSRDYARYEARRSRFELKPGQEIKFVPAEEYVIKPEDLGELMGVSDRDILEWEKAGQEMPTGLIDMFLFMMRNSDQVRKAQERFENL